MLAMETERKVAIMHSKGYDVITAITIWIEEDCLLG
jgi:hypothetical protein